MEELNLYQNNNTTRIFCKYSLIKLHIKFQIKIDSVTFIKLQRFIQITHLHIMQFKVSDTAFSSIQEAV